MLMTATATAMISICPQIDAAIQVNRLGSPDYFERERASVRLRRVGPAALTALEFGASSEDAEIRMRSEGLLPELRLAAVEEFEGESSAEYGWHFPGYSAFRSVAGWDVPARSLFVSLQRRHGGILRAAFDARMDQSLKDDHCRRFRHRIEMTPEGDPAKPDELDVLAYILLSLRADASIREWIGRMVEDQFRNGRTRTALLAGRHSVAGRRLLAEWVAPSLTVEGTTVWHDLVDESKCVEVLPPLRSILGDRKTSPTAKALALCTIARLGSAVDRTIVESLVDDPTPVLGSLQLGDVALASSVHLRGWKLSEFGFVHPKAGFGPFTYNRLAFSTATARSAAVNRWKAALAKDGSPMH